MSNKRTALMKLSDDVKKTIGIPFKVRKDKKQLEGWIIDREYKIAQLSDEIDTLKSAEEFNVDSILDKQDDLELEERRLKQGNALLKEMFETDYEVETGEE